MIEEYSKVDPVYCQVRVMVPKQAILITYTGEKEYANELKEMVDTIIFKEPRNEKKTLRDTKRIATTNCNAFKYM